MSLYYDCATLLANEDHTGGSLKSRVYSAKNIKNTPAHVYALASAVTKWSPVLAEVIEASGLLAVERKLTPALALALTHDLLLRPRGLSCPSTHPLARAITAHRTRLSAELTRVRLRRRHATLPSLAAALDAHAPDGSLPHPRWMRVNTLTTTPKELLNRAFNNYTETTLADVLSAKPTDCVYYRDTHVPDLLALPPGADVSKTSVYRGGNVILQDKASCFPALLLDPRPEDGRVVDACAAPGNKTTHLAALYASHTSDSTTASDTPDTTASRIVAFERDAGRSKILAKMLKTAKADERVDVRAPADFLAADPGDEEWDDVGAILLDPSCSGSGIVGREDGACVFPRAPADVKGAAKGAPKKGKMGKVAKEERVKEDVGAEEAALKERLTALSAFQLHMVEHAMRFPACRRITYSTCSIHGAENEAVVIRSLISDAGREGRWRVLRREEQVEGMKAWGVRGDRGGWVHEVAEACIRCEAGTAEGTMGFFVCGFVRDLPDWNEQVEEEAEEGRVDEEEWTGFSDDEG
ncbi:S-adenosyl-L-methionine-dependent methyltransferase [Trichodelitschia bisporula]|uniref:S-adenosyl-L-methionine-dependent methyltransferase n=1 Tax=Trichodelitschia bisporula TaxID=703511 RepID=A0A6G1HJQ8_9PEZI|nr:S-adenosyl-L-methionine-dependent methyltransferase [Trichodelitschia bisporula]